MYKVFINNRPLILIDNSAQTELVEGMLFLRYDSVETLDTILRLAHEQPVFFKITYLLGENADTLFEKLKSRCKCIEAAGGLVKNAEGKTLLIFRNDKWDLPKGKIEKKEKPEEAALREVEEECGISGLKIVRMLEPTFHTYIHKEKMVLKKTWWYEMICSDTRQLVPQNEEGITEAIWADATEIEKAMENTWLSIREVIEDAC